MTFILSPAPDPKSVAGPALRHAERVSLRLPASAPGIKSGNSEAPNPAAVMDAILLLAMFPFQFAVCAATCEGGCAVFSLLRGVGSIHPA
jgi:hypothetical protein